MNNKMDQDKKDHQYLKINHKIIQGLNRVHLKRKSLFFKKRVL